MPTVRRLGLVGGECSGKSTLAAALAAALPALVVDESLRGFVEREARTPAREEQEPLMREQ
jgi:nicotinamide riboside kinase